MEWVQATAARDDTDECIEWPFYRQWPDFYGKYRGKLVHRMVCVIAHGESPPDKQSALHSCHNPPCCNPRHLRWGTAKENTADMIAANRQTNW